MTDRLTLPPDPFDEPVAVPAFLLHLLVNCAEHAIAYDSPGASVDAVETAAVRREIHDQAPAYAAHCLDNGFDIREGLNNGFDIREASE
jgi:hypothetical protein